MTPKKSLYDVKNPITVLKILLRFPSNNFLNIIPFVLLELFDLFEQSELLDTFHYFFENY